MGPEALLELVQPRGSGEHRCTQATKHRNSRGQKGRRLKQKQRGRDRERRKREREREREGERKPKHHMQGKTVAKGLPL